MNQTIVEFFPDFTGRSCGYCNSKDGHFSHGLWAHAMNPPVYEDLIDRGWRRSGKYCYKPVLSKSCCPLYTIRSNALEFKPSKSQKKILKKFRNYIERDVGGDKLKSTPAPKSQFGISNCLEDSDDDKEDEVPLEEVATAEKKLKFAGHPDVTQSASSSADNVSRPGEGSSPKKMPRPGVGPDPNKPRAKKAKEIRLERKKAKNQGEDASKVQKQQETDNIEDIFESMIHPKPNNKHRFEMRLVKAREEDREFRNSFRESYDVYKKYQVAIHNDKASKITPQKFKRFLCSSPLNERDTGIEPAGRFPERFLPWSYGGYHQQYWIDGNLIFVGVVDILPTCISSVYLYYDPDYSFLSCGTLSTVMEMIFTRYLHRHWSSRITNYYMGYYIHSCPKMRYKSQYDPSWLLCPETYRWVDIKKCLPLLDKAKYARLDVESDKADEATTVPSRIAVSELRVLHDNTVMEYRDFDSDFIQRKSRTEEDDEIFLYFSLVGRTVAKSMLLYRS